MHGILGDGSHAQLAVGKEEANMVHNVQLVGLSIVIGAPIGALLVSMVSAAVAVDVVEDGRLERRGVRGGVVA